MHRRPAPRPLVASLVAAASLAVAPPARAGDWYVDVNGTSCATATGGPSDPFCAIGDALAVAADGDTIHVAPGSYLEHLGIAVDVTIIGTSGAAATDLDGQKSDRVVDVAAGAIVELEGLTIRRGMADVGAGIRVGAGATVVVTRCTITGNEFDPTTFLPSEGAGIAVDHGTLTVIESEVRDNSASHDGGGIYSDGGVVVVTDSTVVANVAGPLDYNFSPHLEAHGGGICSIGGTLTVSSSTIAGNSAGFDDYYSMWGSGGNVFAIDGTVLLEDCELADGFASVIGGAVSILQSTLTVRDSSIRGNHAGDGGGISIWVDSQATIEGSTFDANVTQEVNDWTASGEGGGLTVGDYFTMGTSVVVRDCELTGNLGFTGGAIFNKANLSLERCVVNDNVADDVGDGKGGAIFNLGALDIVGCEIAGNLSTGYSKPLGGGISNWASATLSLTRSTVAGNRCESWSGTLGAGGGIFAFKSSVDLDHAIVAGNVGSTNDVDGAVTSHGHNCIGDTSAATITSLGSGDLLDVDPQFADPANGDYTLAASSPCIDAGDPSLAPGGKDLGGNPRRLDGDLDRQPVIDPGSREFSHVKLAITGVATPGGTLTLDTSGTSGLAVLLFAGVAESELVFPRYGALFVDLGSPWLLVPWGTIPSSVQATIDPTLPVPFTVFLQELALDAASRAGNFGNVVTVEIE